MNIFNKNKGQIMLLSIMILGGVMIGAATIGSFLLRFQISQVNDAGDSTSALFAADAGIEAVSWCFFENSEGGDDNCDASLRVADTFCPADDEFNVPAGTNASTTIDFDDSSVTLKTKCRWDKREGVVTITAQGFKASTTRILETNYHEATPTTSQ